MVDEGVMAGDIASASAEVDVEVVRVAAPAVS
jgi:hypothetical protein